MSQALNTFNNAVQNIPFYDQISGVYEDQMGQRFSTKDPFYEKIPEKSPSELRPNEEMPYKEVRRKPPTNITEKQRKLWKQIMKRAWYHDRNFCGCMPIDLGCGMISCVSIFPIIGSIIAYKMHYKLIKMCHQAGVPAKIQAEMVGNIGLDFLMTLVPLLGVLLSWMKSSSTRNAALFDTWLRQQSDEAAMKQASAQRQRGDATRNGNFAGGAVSPGTQAPPRGQQRPSQQRPGQLGAGQQAPQQQSEQSRAPVHGQPGQARPSTSGRSGPNPSSGSQAPHRKPVGSQPPLNQAPRAHPMQRPGPPLQPPSAGSSRGSRQNSPGSQASPQASVYNAPMTLHDSYRTSQSPPPVAYASRSGNASSPPLPPGSAPPIPPKVPNPPPHYAQPAAPSPVMNSRVQGPSRNQGYAPPPPQTPYHTSQPSAPRVNSPAQRPQNAHSSPYNAQPYGSSPYNVHQQPHLARGSQQGFAGGYPPVAHSGHYQPPPPINSGYRVAQPAFRPPPAGQYPRPT